MTPATNRLAGLVLCGGGSTRMGRDKALVTFQGQPMVLRVAERLEGAASPVLLAPGRPGRLGPLPFPEVADAIPDSGPLGGLVGGLKACPTELLAVVAVDMPFASPDLFSFLAGLHRDEDAVIPTTGSGPQPLHAVYAQTALPTLRVALNEGRLALTSLLSELEVRWVDSDQWRRADPTGQFAVNVNRESDLSELGGSTG